MQAAEIAREKRRHMQLVLEIVGFILLLVLAHFGLAALSWVWIVAVRGLHVPVVAALVAALVFCVAFFRFGRRSLASVLAAVAGSYAAGVVIQYYYGYSVGWAEAVAGVHSWRPRYDSVYDGIKILSVMDDLTFSWEVHPSDSVRVAYLVAALVATVTAAICFALAPPPASPLTAKIVVVRLWHLLVLASYGQYISGRSRFDILFIALPLIGVFSLLSGIWHP